jgi:AraC family transcriptional regulator, regulatory protein of adaptative response / methylated-DNA-[protein]-cysteine methyltransferase
MNNKQVTILRIQPPGYQDGEFIIRFSYTDSSLGKLISAATEKGLCYLAFYERADVALAELKVYYPSAIYIEENCQIQEAAMNALLSDPVKTKAIKLHIGCTDFQYQVWQTLLSIPAGKQTSYGEIARKLGQPGGSRAVGKAVGSNPVAMLIPCHRVLRADGALGGYRWGIERKKAILRKEIAENTDGMSLLVNKT